MIDGNIKPLTDAPQTALAPLRRMAWRRMRHRPLQYVLLICGVAIGVAMMVSVDVANHSAGRAFELSTRAVAGRATHRLMGGPSGLDETLYTALRTSIAGLPAAPVVEDYVVGRDMGETPLRMVGVDIFAEPPFRGYFPLGADGIADAITHLLTHPAGIVMSRSRAIAHGLEPGAAVILTHGGREIPAVIIGLLEPEDDLSRQALDGTIFCDIATAQEMLGMQGRLSRIDLIAENPALLDRVASMLPPDVTLEPAAARGNALRQMTAAFKLNLTALSLLALMVGMFLIYNSVSFSVVQRRDLFGILRCLGVTGGQLFTLILAEAAVLGLMGALLGLGLGVFLGRFLVVLVTQTINDLYFVLNVQSTAVATITLVKGLVVGAGAAVAASLPPAVEAMRTTPRSNLARSFLESRSRKALPRLTAAGGLLILSGGLLLNLPGNYLTAAFGGLFALLFGMALLTPAVTSALMRTLPLIAGRLFGILGRMASRGIDRSLSRTSVAIAALMVAVSVIVGVSIMIGSFRGTVSHWLDATFQADVYLSPPSLSAGRVQDALDPEVIELAAGLAGVKKMVTARHVSVMAPEIGRMVEMISVDGDVSGGGRRYLFTDGDEKNLWVRLAAGNGIMISESLFHRENMAMPPSPVLLMTESGPRRFPVLAVYYDYASETGTIMIGRYLFRANWNDDRITSMAFFLKEGTNAESTAAVLQERLRGRQSVIVQSSRFLRAAALEIFDRTFTITAALQLLATIVAFIGVLSALMSLQLERSRELGVLRATGMSVGQMWRLTFLETGLMGTTAGLLAMPVGWVLAWILIHVINLRSFGWTMEMILSPGFFIQAFAVALAAALLAGIYPAVRLGKMDISRAIRQE